MVKNERNKNFSIIVTQENNLNELTRVIYSSYSHLMSAAYKEEIFKGAQPFITKANPELVKSRKYYAATVDGKIIACGGWSLEKPGSMYVQDGIGHLRHFATLPEYAGKGVGMALYDFIKLEARKEGIHHFECLSSLNAVKFYERAGLQIIKDEDIVLPGDIIFPTVLMGCMISDSG